MRQFSTYRGARRNDFNTVSGRRLNVNFEKRNGSVRGRSPDVTHTLFIPPTQPNKRLPEDQIRHKRMVVPV